MERCIKCESTEVEVCESEAEGKGMVIGAQIGSVAGCALLVPLGGLGALAGIWGGAILGGVGGAKIGRAFSGQPCRRCNNCGNAW